MTRFFLPTDTYLRSSGRVPRPRRGRRSPPRRRGLLPRGLPDTPSTHDEGERSQINQSGVEKLRQRAFIPFFQKRTSGLLAESSAAEGASSSEACSRIFDRGRRETDRSRGSGVNETGGNERLSKTPGSEKKTEAKRSRGHSPPDFWPSPPPPRPPPPKPPPPPSPAGPELFPTDFWPKPPPPPSPFRRA